jgi:3-oxoacyl-[acyl-carrier protein] reductase
MRSPPAQATEPCRRPELRRFRNARRIARFRLPLRMGVLDGRAAIVTGSGRGIGRAAAALLVEHGAQVLVNDLDADAAQRAADELGEHAAAFAGNVVEPGVADALVQAAVDAFGRLDIVVNNAGYTWDGVVHRMSDEQFQAMLDIHAVAPFRIVRAAAPHMRDVAKAERERGEEPIFRKIVNVTSISGLMGNAGQANYATGKAGLIGLTKTLAKEWGQFSINVNAVAFGFVETRLTAAREDSETIEVEGHQIQLGIPAQFRELAAATIPLGRGATPEEAAGAIFFLCSPWSNFVHGQVLNVTGGQIAGMSS